MTRDGRLWSSTVASLIILTILPGSLVYSQNTPAGSESTKSDRSGPSVYIDYVRRGPRIPLHTDDGSEGIWLRLHNNTRSALVMPTFGVPKENGDAGLFYEVRATPGSKISNPPVGERPGHMQSISTIKPGQTVQFSVPSEHLAQGLAIAVRFSYDWENQRLVTLGREPEHWVVFGAENLVQPRRP